MTSQNQKKNFKKVMVTGANGMLGGVLCKYLRNKTALIPLGYRKGRIRADIRDKKSFFELVDKHQPDLIIHLAAITSPEFCEQNPQLCWETNVGGTQNIVEASQRNNSVLIYVSSAWVFDGQDKFYTENSTPNPTTIYGKTKLAGEKMVRSYPNHYIFRASWLFGGKKNDKNFVGKVLRQIKDGKKKIYVVKNKIGSPTHVSDFSQKIMEISTTLDFGTYHVANPGSCSRIELAEAILEQFGNKIKIKKVDDDYFSHYSLPRPYSEVLKSKNSSQDNKPLRSWREALSEYVLSW